MKSLLVIIDALRFDYSSLFEFKSLHLVEHVIADSNWTFPSMASILTGRPPHQSGFGLIPDKEGKFHLDSKVEYRPIRHPTLLHEVPNSMGITEVPQIKIGLRLRNDRTHKKIRVPPMNYKETIKEARRRFGKDFLYVHFKGPHEPYTYSMGESAKEDKQEYLYQPSKYKDEARACAQDIVDFVEEATEEFKRIVVMADHGETLRGEANKLGHGRDFSRQVLHIPMWVNGVIPPGLYAGHQAHNYLTSGQMDSTELVISSNSAYNNSKDIGVSYLDSEKRVITEEIKLQTPPLLKL